MELGRYKLGEKLAVGGMGEIFRATICGVEGFEKEIAVKRIFPDLAADPKNRARFIREAKLVAGLNHPNIVQTYELGGNESELFIAMELVIGVDLASLLSAGPLPPAVAATITYDTLDALDFAHTQNDADGNTVGIVHQDVSPQNIMINTQGQAKLCDFGIARVASVKTAAGRILGKMPYVAPEQLAEGGAEPRTDVFAAGLVLYEMLTSRRLFRATPPPEQVSMMADGCRNALDRRRTPTAPAELREALRPALALKPDDRYANAAAFREAIESYLITSDPAEARRTLARLVKGRVATPRPAPPDNKRTRPLPAPGDTGAVSVVAMNPFDADGPAHVDAGFGQRWSEVVTRAEQYASHNGASTVKSWLRRGGVGLGILLICGLIAGVALGVLGPAATDAHNEPSSSGEPIEPPDDPTEIDPDDPLARRTRAKQARLRRPADRTAAGRGVTVAPAFLNLSSKPWARVWIDGKAIGKTTPLLNFAVVPGKHKIKLKGVNGRSTTFEIEVGPRQSFRRFVDLRQ